MSVLEDSPCTFCNDDGYVDGCPNCGKLPRSTRDDNEPTKLYVPEPEDE